MSDAWDELRRLVEDLPEADLPAVLADVRQHLAPGSARTWPPSWFGSVSGSTPDTAARADQLRAEGFGI